MSCRHRMLTADMDVRLKFASKEIRCCQGKPSEVLVKVSSRIFLGRAGIP